MTRDQFLTAALRNPANQAITNELHRLALPDAWLVSGCLVQTVWNVLTGRPIDHGISDYDIFYFDPDTSWEAEDAVIRDLKGRLGHLGVAIEARNQARVHLWYPGKHSLPYPALSRSTAASKRALMHLRLQNNENETLEKLLNTPPAVEHWFERTWRQSDDVRAREKSTQCRRTKCQTMTCRLKSMLASSIADARCTFVFSVFEKEDGFSFGRCRYNRCCPLANAQFLFLFLF